MIPLIRKLLRPFKSSLSTRIDDCAYVVPAHRHRIDGTLISQPAMRVVDTLQQAGYCAFIVGGAVRDLLLGIVPKDFDVATNATPEQVRKLFRRARLIGRRFQIVHVTFGREIIEVSTFRAAVQAPPGVADDADDNSAMPGKAGQRMHTVDASGRVLRDNIWGQQHEDAARRDFTINALYYDPATQTVRDYHHGMTDIAAARLRMIGDPATRYREDPVRMLRVVRFAAKLGFEIDAHTSAPIATLGHLIHNVPAARLFDEMLKLLLCGQALRCLHRLRTAGLHHGLLPLLDAVLDEPQHERFITLTLNNTDARIRAGQRVSPGFLFAALLWHEVRERWQQAVAANEHSIPALYRAMDDTLNIQMEKLAIQRRYIGDMKEIWGLQPRLQARGRSALKLLAHPCFRAAYDFLLLRSESGEIESGLAEWWTHFIKGNTEERDLLLLNSQHQAVPRRRRRRSKPSGSAAAAIAGADH
jgi:poly(A) polymerase